VALAGAVALSGQASAANCSYTGASGGSWHTASNWSCNEVPDSGDSVDIGTNDNVSDRTLSDAPTKEEERS
jgi:hypothetical protein